MYVSVSIHTQKPPLTAVVYSILCGVCVCIAAESEWDSHCCHLSVLVAAYRGPKQRVILFKPVLLWEAHGTVTTI